MKALILVFVLMASPVAADGLKLPLTVYAGAASLDLHSTFASLQAGHVELNPLGAWLSDRPKTLVVFSAAIDAATVYLLHRYVGKQHPRLARFALYSVAALRVGIAVRNYRVVGRTS